MEQSKYVQEPQNDDDHHDGVQDGFDTASHGDETVHQPQQDTDYDQGNKNLNERHDVFASFFARGHTEYRADEIVKRQAVILGDNVGRSGYPEFLNGSG
jgi:hypothetical protein